MIGDRNLKLVWDTGSSDSLRNLVWNAADSLGYARYFPREGGPIEDDHLPFVNAGVRALDVIDFESQGTFWHTQSDTMDKLDAHSFQVVGNVVMKAIQELEKEK
jgi:Zn-dependent M28 family amino/carboxypeptidase